MKIPFKSYAGVLRFIRDFKQFDKKGEVTRTFTNGYCYWFAFILHSRFPRHSEIMYYSAGNHFACKVYDRVFDITGDITNKHLFFEPWEEYRQLDPVETAHLTVDCIDKTGI